MNNLKPNDNFVWYLYWISERMNIFWKRLHGEQQPWTDDDVFQDNKFTNVYRILDRESQFLLKSVISGDYSPEDLIFRIILVILICLLILKNLLNFWIIAIGMYIIKRIC
jgi:hypothetical protein